MKLSVGKRPPAGTMKFAGGSAKGDGPYAVGMTGGSASVVSGGRTPGPGATTAKVETSRGGTAAGYAPVRPHGQYKQRIQNRHACLLVADQDIQRFS